MHIDGYTFGQVTIDGKKFDSDVIIYRDSVDCPWRRKEGHKLSLADIPRVLDRKPDILIIGTGEAGIMKVPAEVASAIEAKGIKLIIKRTADACNDYNELASSTNVVAALHLTC